MSDSIKVRPAPGIVVRDPATRRPLSPDGETKPRNSYWLRRLAASEVVEIKQPDQNKQRSKKPTIVSKKEDES